MFKLSSFVTFLEDFSFESFSTLTIKIFSRLVISRLFKKVSPCNATNG